MPQPPVMPRGVMMVMREMRNVMAVRMSLMRFCRQGRLGESDDGRRNDASTHGLLHLSFHPDARLVGGIRRERARTVVIL
jgi:hypothetical protein